MDELDLGYRLRASMTSVMVRLCTSQSRRQILPIEDQEGSSKYQSYEQILADDYKQSSSFKLFLG